MNVLDWLAGGGLVTLIGIVCAVWLQGRAVKQAILGYEGNGGMAEDVRQLRAEVAEVRQKLANMDRELRDEIANSRHLLRDEFTRKLTQVEEDLGERIDGLEGRVREVEIAIGQRRVG